MHFQPLFAAAAVALAMSVSPALALPDPIPELELQSRAQCHPGTHLEGSGCSPAQKGHTSCSANTRAVVICTGSGPTWHQQNLCTKGSCNGNCVCI